MSGSTGNRVSIASDKAIVPSADDLIDGYISFPDFEQFCQGQNGCDQRREQSAVKT